MSRSKRAARVILALLAVQTVAGPVTLRDLARRSDDQIRGPRLLWRLWAGTNLAGVATYWLVGRRR